MKIIIERWGLIERFEYDLSKSMIVTYGENNIGKSYAMQMMYLLLKNMLYFAHGNTLYMSAYIRYFTNRESGSKITENMLMDFVMGQEKELDITSQLIEFHSKRLSESLMPALIDSCRNTFGTFEELLKQNPVITLVIDENHKLLYYLREQKIIAEYNRKPVILKKVETDFHKVRNNKTHLDIYVYGNQINDPLSKVEEVLDEMNVQLSVDIACEIENVYFLPASRSGIYNGMNSFGPILAELAKNRTYVKKTLVIPTLSEPISDYFMALSNIHSDTRGAYEKYASMLESALLQGKVEYNSVKRSMVYCPYDEELELDMTDTSSMISEISPITAFLKYIVKSVPPFRYIKSAGNKIRNAKSVIFIEEPEAHLHPKNQIALIEILVKLSQENVTMIISSHSNYIFNKLNNMIMAKEMEKDSYMPILLKKLNGKSKSQLMECDEFGASDENFADTANQLYEERETIIQQIIDSENEG